MFTPSLGYLYTLVNSPLQLTPDHSPAQVFEGGKLITPHPQLYRCKPRVIVAESVPVSDPVNGGVSVVEQ